MKSVPFGRFKAVCAIFRRSLYYFFFIYFEENTGGRGGGCQHSNGRASLKAGVSRAERIRQENIRGTEKAWCFGDKNQIGLTEMVFSMDRGEIVNISAEGQRG